MLIVCLRILCIFSYFSLFRTFFTFFRAVFSILRSFAAIFGIFGEIFDWGKQIITSLFHVFQKVSKHDTYVIHIFCGVNRCPFAWYFSNEAKLAIELNQTFKSFTDSEAEILNNDRQIRCVSKSVLISIFVDIGRYF